MSKFNGTEEMAPRAREQTDEEIAERRETMHQLSEAIQDSFREGKRVLWKLAAQLDLWDDQDGWRVCGYDKLEDWLADPEVSMTRGRFTDLVNTYRELTRRGIEPAEMQKLEHSKVRIALPAVKQGRTLLEDALDDVAKLGARDLREKYQDPAAPKKSERSDNGDGADTDDDQSGRPDQSQWTPPPENPTDDVPVMASEAPVIEAEEEPVEYDLVRTFTLVEVLEVVGRELKDQPEGPDQIKRIGLALNAKPVAG